ncbi:protein abrupt-like isoform X2 [Maniola hyperantus]|uniref:protein abrupt-like isoform X2 n=1 Tax=Aphantopus hyperantus TaxID=2795564 RepID=UPI0015686CE1|nr:protein abrupt-like isoform X2 [Maniola hyperantus]XP_034835814.1 protein abrupt-like isoform X2 [Maniola hyperantus]
MTSVIGALGRMLTTGALSDVTLSASGASLRAHRLVLAACSQYFAQLFKDVDTDNNTLVVVLGCEVAELRLLLTFMYTGEVTASRQCLPALLRLAHTLQVSGLTDADTNTDLQQPLPEPNEPEAPINLEKSNTPTNYLKNESLDTEINKPTNETHRESEYLNEIMGRNEKDKLSKLDQIVQNLYSTHRVGNFVREMVAPPLPALPSLGEPPDYDKRWRSNSSVCTICNKRLSNQYNLRVHMETHAGRRHACRACSHVSRSRDALRKHVAYRHAATQHRM